MPPKDPGRHEFVKVDMCSPEFAATLKSFQPDSVVHMAFVVPPMHNQRKMRAINVEGSRKVLEATVLAGAERLLVTSSATVLGARPDNPVPLDDSWPGRAGPQFSYAAHKVELEAMLAQFAQEHPRIAVSCVRPCIVGGPHMDNYLRRLLFGMPIIVLLDGVDSAIQLVHEDDVSAAIREVLVRQATGTYNLAPPDAVLFSEMAELTGRRRIERAVLAGMVPGLGGVEDALSAARVPAGVSRLRALSVACGREPFSPRVGVSVPVLQPRDVPGNAERTGSCVRRAFEET